MAKTITALKFAPGEPPSVVYLKTRKHDLEYAVSLGARYLCNPAIAKIEDDVALLYNAEACLLGLPGNRRVDEYVIAGTFYLVGIDDSGQLTSLSYEALSQYWMFLYDPDDISDKEVSDHCFDGFKDILMMS